MFKRPTVKSRCGYNKQKRRLERKENRRKKIRSVLHWFLYRGIFLFVAVAGLIVGLKMNENKLPELNPFRWNQLKSIEISGNKRLSADDILNIIEIDSGMILKNINLQNTTEKLLKEAWIQSAQVSFSFPSTLKIELNESKPIMSAFEAGHWTVYSSEGKVLPMSVNSAYQFPVLSAKNTEERLLAGIFLKTLKDADERLYHKVSQIEIIDDKNAIEIFFNGDNFKTYFAMDRQWNEELFNEYWTMKNLFVRDLQNAKILDLRFPGFAYIIPKRKANNSVNKANTNRSEHG